MVPALAARWRRAGLAWSGALTLRIAADPATDQEGGTCALTLASDRLRLSAPTEEATRTVRVRLQPGAFTQLLFGFRPVWWVAQQPGNQIPEPAKRLMETLFPAEPGWIAPTDGF
jgi:hypothetical protein